MNINLTISVVRQLIANYAWKEIMHFSGICWSSHGKATYRVN
jgi:hypothetical protein